MTYIKTAFQDNLQFGNLISGCSIRGASLETLVTLLGVDSYPIVMMNQTHSTNCEIIDDSFECDSLVMLDNTDAIISTKSQVSIVVKSADCLPILIYHPSGLVGVVHAGRKGTEDLIICRVLERIIQTFGYRDQFTFWFGPAICGSCYQIDRDLNLYYDLVKSNKQQIFSTISSHTNVVVESGLCTSCRNDLLYSYRCEGQNAGRLFSLILKK